MQHDNSPPEGQHPSGKRKRASRPKTRTGCSTCKLRHVKCDERKPECERCTSTGRKCDGYVAAPRLQKKVSTVATPLELEATEYFYDVTAPGLSLYFDGDFWNHLVRQMSHSEPAIRFAVAAIGSLRRECDTGYTPQSAVSLYNKAISALSKPPGDGPSTASTLAASVLFICFEFMRGNIKNAYKHLKGGMGVAASESPTPSPYAELAKVTEDDLVARIVQFLYRVETFCSQFTDTDDLVIPSIRNDDIVPQEFKTVEDGRISLVHLANRTNRFLLDIKGRTYKRVLTPTDFERQSDILAGLDMWARRGEEFLLSHTLSERDICAAKLLRMHLIIQRIWLRRYIVAEESAYDDSHSDFQILVTLAESVLETRLSTKSPTFLFDADLLAPLFYTATKCRHSDTRRRALELLRSLNRREGPMDSNLSAAIAERIIAMEEEDIDSGDDTALPSEQNRIHNANLEIGTGKDSKKNQVTFYTKPQGIDKPWRIWTETISLP